MEVVEKTRDSTKFATTKCSGQNLNFHVLAFVTLGVSSGVSSVPCINGGDPFPIETNKQCAYWVLKFVLSSGVEFSFAVDIIPSYDAFRH
ncbi:hypothetical protein NC652_028154 [Populus alba x Populus x berolinensis]|nr:hypothetical protein NC652_028154 [Populus alba x Populus x berolinensis]